MLNEFLKIHKKEILKMTEIKSMRLAGIRHSSDQLRKGLPIFYDQLIEVLDLEELFPSDKANDVIRIAQASSENDDEVMALASGKGAEAQLAKSAGIHGKELMSLGYTLSHAVHAYGSMCQAITELAALKKERITPDEFHNLNRCLDVAIAGAVTEFQNDTDIDVKTREVEHLGFLAHELRNALTSAKVALQMIKKGAVGFGGNTANVLDLSLQRMQFLIDASLTQVRLQIDPKVYAEQINIKQMCDLLLVTAQTEADFKNQTIELQVESGLYVLADRQLLYSAVSNLIQNAIKYTKDEGFIQVRAKKDGASILIEVEDECGGLTDGTVDLFEPYEQQNKNRQGLGLGLTIAKKAIDLNSGRISVKNLPQKGCIFFINLPLNPQHAMHSDQIH